MAQIAAEPTWDNYVPIILEFKANRTWDDATNEFKNTCSNFDINSIQNDNFTTLRYKTNPYTTIFKASRPRSIDDRRNLAFALKKSIEHHILVQQPAIQEEPEGTQEPANDPVDEVLAAVAPPPPGENPTMTILSNLVDRIGAMEQFMHQPAVAVEAGGQQEVAAAQPAHPIHPMHGHLGYHPPPIAHEAPGAKRRRVEGIVVAYEDGKAVLQHSTNTSNVALFVHTEGAATDMDGLMCAC